MHNKNSQTIIVITLFCILPKNTYINQSYFSCFVKSNFFSTVSVKNPDILDKQKLFYIVSVDNPEGYSPNDIPDASNPFVAKNSLGRIKSIIQNLRVLQDRVRFISTITWLKW